MATATAARAAAASVTSSATVRRQSVERQKGKVAWIARGGDQTIAGAQDRLRELTAQAARAPVMSQTLDMTTFL